MSYVAIDAMSLKETHNVKLITKYFALGLLLLLACASAPNFAPGYENVRAS